MDCDLDCNMDCNLDHDPEDVPVYMEDSFFHTTKRITLLFIVQSLLHHNPPNIWIKMIQIEYLHGTKYIDLDCDLDCDPGNFAHVNRVLQIDAYLV